MAKRQGAHASNVWSVPGGHLEFNERWEDAARREVEEETGMQIKNIRFLAVTNDIMPADGKHYISIWLTTDWAANEPSWSQKNAASIAGLTSTLCQSRCSNRVGKTCAQQNLSFSAN